MLSVTASPAMTMMFKSHTYPPSQKSVPLNSYVMQRRSIQRYSSSINQRHLTLRCLQFSEVRESLSDVGVDRVNFISCCIDVHPFLLFNLLMLLVFEDYSCYCDADEGAVCPPHSSSVELIGEVFISILLSVFLWVWTTSSETRVDNI